MKESAKRKRHFDVKRNGVPVDEYPIRGSVRAGITYSQEFEIWQAAHTAGLDMERLWRGSYDPRFLEKVLAWWHLRNLVDLHNADAANRKAKK